MTILNKQNIFFTFLSRLSIVLSGFGVSILTAHFLGPIGRGEYFYIMTLVNIISVIAALGMQTSNTYLVASQPKLLNNLIVNSFWISLIFCSLITAAVLYFITRSNTINHYSLWFALILTPCNLFYLFGVSLMGGIGRFNLLNYYQILMNVLTVIAVIIAGFFTAKLNLILATISISWLLLVIFLFYSLFNRQESFSFKFDRKVFNEGFHYAFKAYLIGIGTYLLLRINVFFLQELSPPAELGYFSIAAQICEALVLLPMTVNMVLFPHLVKSKILDLKIILTVVKQVGLLMLILFAVTWLIAPIFIGLFFGEKFMPSVEILRFILPGYFFYGLVTLLTQHLAARGLPPIMLVIWLVGLLINGYLSYLLIPVYHAIGAGIAMSLSYGFVLILFSYLIYQDGIKLSKKAMLVEAIK